MKVAKWGNSLAVRLPAAMVERLQLVDGDDIEVRADDPRTLTVAKKPSIDELFARVRNLRGAIPKGYAFDREQANGR